ncbi:hypothetical protein E2C01_055229 [Portunus trituberculatus]|uniref:Uncharacterized protein n=1 Tax=Portunus trituberculatus TaxID=210409 RepID=A0A5B7GUQ3_PORTR|nr:hypothetical protein [Portunus trituberculatus]
MIYVAGGWAGGWVTAARIPPPLTLLAAPPFPHPLPLSSPFLLLLLLCFLLLLLLFFFLFLLLFLHHPLLTPYTRSVTPSPLPPPRLLSHCLHDLPHHCRHRCCMSSVSTRQTPRWLRIIMQRSTSSSSAEKTENELLVVR